MKTTKKEYDELVKKASLPSPKGKNCIWAFCVGGAICTLGQLLFTLYSSFGLSKDVASAFVSSTIIALTALFTALGLFDKLAKHAGAGTLVPVSGFANAVVSPAIEFKSEGVVMGLCAKLFSIAGPVLVFGITASVIYGIILYIVKMFG